MGTPPPPHSTRLTDHPRFHDLLFHSLEYVLVGWVHPLLWWRIRSHCTALDDLVTLRLRHLRTSCPQPHQLNLPPHVDIGVPAAVVELASLGTHGTALGRAECLLGVKKLVEAHLKGALAEQRSYAGDADGGERVTTDGGRVTGVTEEEVTALLVITLIECQCEQLVSNLYYASHFVFSLPDAHPIWVGIGLLRAALQRIMQLDVSSCAGASGLSPSIRKQVSLQDLIKVSKLF